MRDAVILLIVFVGAVAALRRPWYGVLTWTWLSIMNPHRFAWGIAYSSPLAAIAAGSTLVGLLFTKDRQSPFKGAAAWWLAAFSIWITISWQLGLDPTGDYAMWDRVMKIFLMTFVALALLSEKHQVMAFAWITVGSIALLAVKGGVFTIATGGNYRVWGPPESFIFGNNEMALATIVIIPLLHFLQLQLTKRWMRHAMTLAILLSAIAAIGSYSRGALLAIVAMSGLFWWRSRYKFVISCAIVLGALLALPMMPDSWWDRMESISTYSEDASAMGRINAWVVSWQTATHYFFGGGMSHTHQFLFDAYGLFPDNARVAHSIYFQILGNHGFVGLCLFLMMWISAYRSAGWLRREAVKFPEAKWAADLGGMTQASLAGFAVGGAFLSLPYFDLPYNIMVMILVTRRWVECRTRETEPKSTLLKSFGRPGAKQWHQPMALKR